MKRVRTYKADNGKVAIKLTVEISTSRGTSWARKGFLETVSFYYGHVVVGLINLGFTSPKIVRK
jgi:hypothetical protein